MKGRFKTVFVFMLIMVISLTSTLATGCSKQQPAIVPPFVPPHYYECREVQPETLMDIYWVSYADYYLIENEYSNKYYVFKDIRLEEWMLQDVDDGYIWVDRIRCYVINIDDLGKYKIGDKIDLVGLNKGPANYTIAEITFIDCFVIPAGSIALPKDLDAGSITPGY